MERPGHDVVPVVIVGAGPTGVTLALLLAGYGVRCLLLDRWDGVYPQPRAVHLDDEVCRILSRLGLGKQFAAISRPGLGLRLVDRNLAVLAEFRRSQEGGQHGFPQANMFDQPDLEAVLRDALGTRPSVSLQPSTVVTSVRQTGQEVEVGFTEQLTGRTNTVTARYVVGCDGANSVVRTQMGTQMRDLGFEQRWLVVDVQSDALLGHWEGVHQVCDPERAATYMRIGAGRHRWEFRLLPGESAADLAPERVLELIRPWTAGITADRLHVIRSAEYTFRAQVARRWRSGRVFLAGDAAHLTPPFIGQGLGAGLRDADNLSWKLAGALQGRLGDEVLDTYERERKAHARAMIRLAVLTGRAMTGGGRTGDAMRRLIAPRLRLVPGLRARVVDSATPRLGRSSFVPRSRAWRSLPHLALSGGLCPNALLDDGTRLDETAAAFVLVTLDDGPGPATEARGGTVVQVAPMSVLGRWLRRRGARYAIVRPDGTVLTAGRRTERALNALTDFPRPVTRSDVRPAPSAPGPDPR